MNNAIPPSLIMNPVYTPPQQFPNGPYIQVQTGSHSGEKTQNDSFATPKFPQAMPNCEKRKQQSIEKISEVLTRRLRTLSNTELALILQHVVLAEDEGEQEFFKGLFGVNEEPTVNTKVISSEELKKELKERIQKDHKYAIETQFFLHKCLIDEMAHQEIVSTADSIVKHSVSVANKYFKPLSHQEDQVRETGRSEGLHGTLLMNRAQPSTFHNSSDLAHRTLPERTFNSTGIQFDGVSMYDRQRGGCNEITSTIMSSPSSNSDAGSERATVQSRTSCSTQISHTEQEEERGGESCKTKVTSSKEINDSQIDGNPITEEQLREDANSSQESANVDSIHPNGTLHETERIISANLVKPPRTRRDDGDFDGNQLDLAPATEKPTTVSSTLCCSHVGGSKTLKNSESGKSKQDQTLSESETVRSIPCNDAQNDKVLDNESIRMTSHENNDNLIEKHTEQLQGNVPIEMVENAEEVRDVVNATNSENVDASVEQAAEGSSDSTVNPQPANLQEDGQVQEATTSAGRPVRSKFIPSWIAFDNDKLAKLLSQDSPSHDRKVTRRNRSRARSTRTRKTAINDSIEEQDLNVIVEPVATTSQNQDSNGISSEAISKASHSESSDAPFVLNLNLYKSTTEETGANISEEVTAVSSASTTTKPKRKRYPRKNATTSAGRVSEKRLRSEPSNHEDSQKTATTGNQNTSDPFDPRNQIQLPVVQYPEPTQQVGHTNPPHLPGDPFFRGGLVQQNNNSLHYQIPQYNTDFTQPSFNPGFQFNFASNSEYINNYQSQPDIYYTGNL